MTIAKSSIIIGVVCAIVCITVVVVVPSVVITQKKHQSSKRNIVLKSHQATQYTKELSVVTLVNQWQDAIDWNIIDTTHGDKLIRLVNNTLQVRYPRRSFSPSGQVKGGFQFYAAPSQIFPTKNVEFSYKIFAPSGFNWVKGGKLPGIWFGDIGANGGNHNVNGSSFRIMWRENGDLEAYLYTQAKQNVQFYNQSGLVDNNEYGTSLWRGMFTLQPNSWNTITLKASINSDKDVFNGHIGLTVNNVTKTFNEMNWGNPNINIEGLMMHTFFGGSDATWATPVDQHLYFKDFNITTIK